MVDWFLADQMQELVSYFLHYFIDILNKERNLLTVASVFLADA